MDLHTLGQLQTEAVNARTAQIDQIPTLDLCRIINAEDAQVASSITPFLPQIAEAIDGLASRVRGGGRVVYVGAGTSGRLGILDASEIPPTFAAPPSQFVGIIAGGDAAIRRAQEGAEDSVSQGEADLTALQLNPELDSVIGIAASGRTPYVLGCMGLARRLGCLTIGVVCASPSAMSRSGDVDIMIAPLPGPEVVTGSTRLKAGTATKLVLNMLSTGTMIRIGKTYGNQMVDLVASNEKLEQRSRNILRRLSRRCAGMSEEELDAVLAQCKGSVKLSLVVVETGKSVEECRQDLESVGGILAKVLEQSMEPANLETAERRLILCIDGGATKTAAVVADETGRVVGRGRAGACNLTDGLSTDEAVRILVTATRNALDDASISSSLGHCFRSVWIGLAGIDRDRFRETLTPALYNTFVVSGKEMRLTNDVDLLAAAMDGHPEVSSAVVVIAGTGSVAMRYERDVPRPSRIARSGGWGHLLGDEGGGYAIGLQALKQTLTVLEEMRLGVTSGPLGVLARMILEKLGCEELDDKVDLVSEILMHRSQQSIKARIASLAEGVLNLVGEDEVATAVVEAQITHLVDQTMGRLLHPRSVGYKTPNETGLVLSGSLFGHEMYRKMVLDRVGGQFAFVEVVGDAASVAAHSLAMGSSRREIQ